MSLLRRLAGKRVGKPSVRNELLSPPKLGSDPWGGPCNGRVGTESWRNSATARFPPSCSAYAPIYRTGCNCQEFAAPNPSTRLTGLDRSGLQLQTLRQGICHIAFD